jgi:hypothetical protein
MKRTQHILLALIFLMIAGADTAFSQTKTWTGAVSTAWETAGNWNPSGAPSSTNNIVIPNTTNKPIFNNASYTALNSISIASGKSMTIQNGASLSIVATSSDVQGISVEGTLTINTGGSLTFTGTSAPILAYMNIEASGSVSNSGTITINAGGDIYFVGGTFNCSGGTVTTNANGLMDGVGTYAGCTYTNSSGAYIGTDAVIDCITFSNGLTNNGIMRFDLNGTTACTNHDRYAVTGTMTFGGTFTAVDGGVSVGNALQVITYTSRVGTFSNSNVNIGGGKYANVSYGASALTLNISSTPLPVEFINFDAQNTEGGKNQLLWATATEVRSQHYEVERSDDGTKFYQIGTVKAKGYGAKYDFIDVMPKAGINYYRLKQVDTDGTFSYTKTEAVETGKGKKSVKVFPTLTEGVVNIETEDLSKASLTVYNAMGQMILSTPPTNQINLVGVPSGVYYVHVARGNSTVVEKVIKQ